MVIPNSDVITMAEKFSRALASKDAAAMRRLIQAYQDIYESILPRIELLLTKIELTGEITASQLYRMSVYKDLIDTIQKELDQYATFMKVELRNIANEAILSGNKDSILLMRQILIEAGLIENIVFNAADPNVIKKLLGFLDPGGSLWKTLEGYGPFTADKVSKKIIEGVAQGLNPKVIARMIQEAMGENLTAAMRTARTVQLWAYREASRQSYQNFNQQYNMQLVKGWTWHANLDDKTCAACWMLDGVEFKLEDPLDGHYNCRCSMIPITMLDPTPTRRQGIDEFQALTEAEQRKILGPGRFDLWKSGGFQLDKLWKSEENKDYGSMKLEKTLKELTGGK